MTTHLDAEKVKQLATISKPEINVYTYCFHVRLGYN